MSENENKTDFWVVVTYACPKGHDFDIRMRVLQAKGNKTYSCPEHGDASKFVAISRDTGDINPAAISKN